MIIKLDLVSHRVYPMAHSNQLVPVNDCTNVVRGAMYGWFSAFMSFLIAKRVFGILLAELSPPKPAVCVCSNDPTFGQQLFDVPLAEVEAEGEPHTVFDDFRWETEDSYTLERYAPTV